MAEGDNPAGPAGLTLAELAARIRELQAKNPDQPVLIVHPHGLVDAAIPETIEAMAADRIRALRALRAGLRILEKHLIEIAEAEEQQRVLGQLAFDAAILGHHGSELRFGGHAAGKLMSITMNVEAKFKHGLGPAWRFYD